MFRNIAEKLKILIYVLLVCSILVFFIIGLVSLIYSNGPAEGIVLFIIWFFGGSLSSWISLFFAYGFVELIERVSSIDDQLKNMHGNKELSDLLESQLNKGQEETEEKFYNTLEN